MVGRTNECDDGMSVSEHFAEKLRSFREVEVSKLADLGGDSVAELLGGGAPGAQIGTGAAAIQEIVV